MDEPSEGFFVDNSDFISEDQYHLYQIDPYEIPTGFKVWKHPYPPLDRHMNIYGGNVFGLSITEMMVRGIDENTIKLLTSNNYKKINQYYREKGIFIIRSRELKEFFLIPKALEAQLRREINYKITQIIDVIDKVKSEKNIQDMSVGTFCDSEDIIFNVIKTKIPRVKFIRISQIHKQRKNKFDLIYVASELKNVLLHIHEIEGRKTKIEQIPSSMLSFFLSYAYDLLEPSGILYIISSNMLRNSSKKINITINKKTGDIERKKLLIFSHLFKCTVKVSPYKLEIDRNDFFNSLRIPHLNRQQIDDILKISKDWRLLSEKEIEGLPYKNMTFPQDNAALEGVLFYEEFFEEREKKYLNPPYFKEYMKELFNIENIPFKLISIFSLTKRNASAISRIKNNLERENLCGSNVNLVAPYKKTFQYLLEALKVIKEIKEFNFDISIAEMKKIKFPFKMDEVTFPINHVMRIQNLISPDNVYFEPILLLADKIPNLRQIWRSIGFLEKGVDLVQSMDKLYLCGFKQNELKEIFWIVTGHGPMSRVVFGKYPLKSMDFLTKKIKKECFTFKCIEDTLNFVTFCSIVEVIAANHRECTLNQWNRYFELLKYGKNVTGTLEGKITWASLQAKEIEKYEGTLNTVAQVLIRIFRYDVPKDFAYCAEEKSHEELMLDAEYSDKKYQQLKEIQALLRLMLKFKEKNYPEDDFSRPYFFREFLECGVHGAGKSITKLGLCRAFKLLWLAVISSGCKKINFNTFPVTKENIHSIQVDLDTLDERDLSVICLEDISAQLSESGTAFVYDTGFQLHIDESKSVVNVAHINIGSSIKKIKRMVSTIRKKPFLHYDSRMLRCLEHLFSDVGKYDKVYEKEIFRFNQLGGSPERIHTMSKNKKEIEKITYFLYNTFSIDLFNPTDIYKKLKLLSDYAPSLLSLIVHELAEYEEVKVQRKEYIRTLTEYTLKCLKKLQALATSRQEDFQNIENFNDRYMADFGSATVQNIALSTKNIRELEKTFKSLPYPFQVALVIALTFQDMAKLPSLQKTYKDSVDFACHGEAGAELLTQINTLANLGINAYTTSIAILLIRHHGIVGQVLRGEYFIDSLYAIMEEKSLYLLDSFFLHCVLAVAAFEDDFLTYDLFREFQTIWRMLRSAVGKENPSESFTTEYFQKATSKAEIINEVIENEDIKGINYLIQGDDKDSNESGKKLLCIERLLRLIGCPSIQVKDIILAVNNPNMSSAYFYRSGSILKNIGHVQHNIQVSKAISFYKLFVALPRKYERFVVESLTSVSNNIKFLFVEKSLQLLSVENQLKLILIVIRGFYYCNKKKKLSHFSSFVTFENLLQVIGTRIKKIEEELESMSIDDIFSDSCIAKFLQDKRGIVLTVNEKTLSIYVSFSDAVSVNEITEEMRGFSSIRELEKFYQEEIILLQKNGNVFDDQIEVFTRFFHEKLEALKVDSVYNIHKRMEKINSLIVEDKAEPIKLKEFYDRVIRTGYFSESHIHLLRDKYEYLSGVIKNSLARNCLEKLRHATNIGELEQAFRWINTFFRKNHSFFGKDFHNMLLREYNIQKKNFKVPRT